MSHEEFKGTHHNGAIADFSISSSYKWEPWQRKGYYNMSR